MIAADFLGCRKYCTTGLNLKYFVLGWIYIKDAANQRRFSSVVKIVNFVGRAGSEYGLTMAL